MLRAVKQGLSYWGKRRRRKVTKNKDGGLCEYN